MPSRRNGMKIRDRLDGRIESLEKVMGQALAARYFQYGLVSLAALAVDLSAFQMLVWTGLAAAYAAAAGYVVGIGAHWVMSSRLVFRSETYIRGSAGRRRQRMLFALSALLGLALTTAIVGSAELIGMDVRLAKLAAVAMSFQAVWLVRRLYVFAP